jgi:hypothetical protein
LFSMLSLPNRMKNRTRYVLALTLVATTLCASRLFASDQNSRSETRVSTEKLVARLTRSFSQVVTRSPLLVQRRMAAPIVQPILIVSTARVHCIAISPLQANLPPPLV